MVPVAALIILALVLLFSLKYQKRKELERRLQVGGKQIPKVPGLPVFGYALQINESTTNFKFAELAKRYGDIYYLRLLNRNVVVLNSEALIRRAYCSETYGKHFSDRSVAFYGSYFRHDCESVIFRPGGREYVYKQMRKTFMKALHTYGTGINNLADKVLVEVGNVRHKIDGMKTKEFEFVDFITRSLANVMSLVLVKESIPEGHKDQTLFYHKAEALDFFGAAYIDILLSAIPSLRHLPMTRFWKQYRQSVAANKGLVDKYFHEVREHHYEGDEEGLVHFYLEQQRKQQLAGEEVFFTDQKIISQIFETIEAGVVTNSALISSSILVLIHHPEIQVKLQEELDRVIGQGRMPEYDDRRNCPYMMAFEREMHRYINVLPVLIPRVCNEDLNFDGYYIQKNTIVVANTWFVHHDERFWGDPWNFRPERFLDERGEILPLEGEMMRSVIGFGTGERRCTGETFAKTRYFLYMSTLLQSYRFETPKGIKQRSCDPRDTKDFETKLTMRPRPFMVRAVER